MYFLPTRGPMEKADGVIQEEIIVMHHFFGKEIFEHMVLIATNLPDKKYQALSFDKKEYDATKQVFHLAMEQNFPEEIDRCPPIAYIGLNDSPQEVLDKIQSASVIHDAILPLKFVEDTCAKCSVKIRSDSENKRLFVVGDSGNNILYKESKCHPYYVQRFNTAQKFFGGIAHIATLGIPLAIGAALKRETWPGFMNSDEWCAACKCGPGSKGCNHVGILFHFAGRSVEVDHTNLV